MRATAVWKPFFDWLAARPRRLRAAGSRPIIAALPARHFWDAAFLKANAPDFVLSDDRPGAPGGNVFWRGKHRRGRLVHPRLRIGLDAGPADRARQPGAAGRRAVRRARATGASRCISTRAWPARRPRRSRRRATRRPIRRRPTPSRSPSARRRDRRPFPAFPATSPTSRWRDAMPRTSARRWTSCASWCRTTAPTSRRANYFEPDWRAAFWGANYPRLRQVKDKYDPDGLFFVHHGVGSEDWSPDGFTRL